MEPIPYTITLTAPATVRVVDYDTATKRAYISVVAVRSQMRRRLKRLIDEYNLPSALEVELFGELRPDGFKKASAFCISGALCDLPVLNRDSEEKVALPAGTVLERFLQTDVPSNSPLGLAVLMSLVGVSSLKAATTSNEVACVVSVNTSSIDLEELYSLEHPHGGQNVQKAAREWLPVVRRAIISYFASRPEEMFRMPSRGFEKLIAELLRNEGFEVTLTPETRDGGYDILAVRHTRITGDEVFLVECKRYARNSKITVGLIRSLIGVVQLGNATKGMLVTTSQLTGAAKTLVTSNSSRLMAHDYETLVEWLNITFAA